MKGEAANPIAEIGQFPEPQRAETVQLAVRPRLLAPGRTEPLEQPRIATHATTSSTVADKSTRWISGSPAAAGDRVIPEAPRDPRREASGAPAR
jgi:hypothetical protein